MGETAVTPTAEASMGTSELEKRTEHCLRQIQPCSKHRLAARHLISSDGTGLLVIDMQRFFIDPLSHASFPQAEEIVGNVQSLLASFRSRGLPVLFTRHGYLADESPGIMGKWWGDVLRIEDPLSVIDDRVRPLDGERIFRKTRYSAFIGTDLESALKELKVTRLVIAGVQTHLCCESTARDAFMRDIDVFFAVDATASDSDDLHLGSLRNLADGFAVVVTTEEVRSCLIGEK